MFFSDKIKHAAQSDFARNSAKLISANVFAQVIGLIVYPLLTRLYSAEDFGLVNLFTSIGGVIVLLATAEYQYAIVLPKDEKKAAAAFHAGGFISMIIVGLVILSIPFRHIIADLFKTPQFADVYALLPLFILLSSFWNLLNYWYIRQKSFGNISTYQMSQSLVGASTKWAFGAGGYLQFGLIFSTLIGSLTSLITSLITAARKHVLDALFHIDPTTIKQVSHTYSNFPKYSLPRALVNQFFGQIPILILTPIFGIEQIGYWSMALLLAFAPISMITKSLYQVMYQKTTSDVNQHKTIWPLFRKFLLYSMAVVIPAFCILYFILPDMAEWFLGAGWGTSGVYIRYMLPWLVVSILVSSTSFISDIFFKQRIGLFYEILLAALRLIGVGIGIYIHSFTAAIAGYAVGSAIAVFAQLIWLLSIIRNYERSL